MVIVMNRTYQKINKSLPTLKQFLLQQEVKKLYRNIFRTIRKVPDANYRMELKEWAKQDFRNNTHHTDEVTIKMCIKYGERCLKELETNINLAK